MYEKCVTEPNASMSVLIRGKGHSVPVPAATFLSDVHPLERDRLPFTVALLEPQECPRTLAMAYITPNNSVIHVSVAKRKQ